MTQFAIRMTKKATKKATQTVARACLFGFLGLALGAAR